MKIMVLNLGSTSFKFKLFEMDGGETLLAHGGVECIGDVTSPWELRLPVREEGQAPCPRHEDAFDLMMGKLVEQKVLKDFNELAAIGYKAVHGGSLSGAAKVNEDVMAQMEKYVSFAPAHNPMYLRMMRAMTEKYPQLPQAACFETAFHQTVPLYRAVYGVPYEWVEKYGIRRYGFHGSSHSYIAMKMAELEPTAKRVISIHLGGSCSICAIQDGKSVATSMGATPQSGLFHGNRVGDFDVFCLPALTEALGSQEAVMKELSKNGGFLGLSGVSSDNRPVLAAMAEGNERAKLSFDAFCDNIVGYVGMYTAYMGGVDAIVFTGGIGQKSPEVRGAVCEKLNLPLDTTKKEGKLNAPESKTLVYALETNEELMVARGTKKCLFGE